MSTPAFPKDELERLAKQKEAQGAMTTWPKVIEVCAGDAAALRQAITAYEALETRLAELTKGPYEAHPCRGHWHVRNGGYEISTDAGSALDEALARSEAARMNAEWNQSKEKLVAALSSMQERAAADTKRLDWLFKHEAHVEEFPNKGEFQVVGFNAYGEDTCLSQRSKSMREAIDAAMASQDETPP